MKIERERDVEGERETGLLSSPADGVATDDPVKKDRERMSESNQYSVKRERRGIWGGKARERKLPLQLETYESNERESEFYGDHTDVPL